MKSLLKLVMRKTKYSQIKLYIFDIFIHDSRSEFLILSVVPAIDLYLISVSCDCGIFEYSAINHERSVKKMLFQHYTSADFCRDCNTTK